MITELASQRGERAFQAASRNAFGGEALQGFDRDEIGESVKGSPPRASPLFWGAIRPSFAQEASWPGFTPSMRTTSPRVNFCLKGKTAGGRRISHPGPKLPGKLRQTPVQTRGGLYLPEPSKSMRKIRAPRRAFQERGIARGGANPRFSGSVEPLSDAAPRLRTTFAQASGNPGAAVDARAGDRELVGSADTRAMGAGRHGCVFSREHGGGVGSNEAVGRRLAFSTGD